MTNRVPSTARKIWFLLSPAERRSAQVLSALLVIGMALETLGIGLVIPAIALIVQPDTFDEFPVVRSAVNVLGEKTPRAVIVAAMIALTGVYLIKNLFLGFQAWYQARFAFSLQAGLSQRLFAAYLRQPYAFHLQNNSAELLRNVAGEVSIFTNNALIPGIVLFGETLVLFGLGFLLVSVEPLGAVMVMGVLGSAGIIFHRLTSSRVGRWGRIREQHEGLRFQHLQQGLSAVKDIKLLGREGEFLEQYRSHNMRSARAMQLFTTFQQLPRLWLELLAVVGLAILVVAMLAQGRDPQSVLPVFGVFAAAAFRLMPSANRILSSIQALRYGLPAIDKLYTQLRLNVPPPQDESTVRTPFSDCLRLDNVSFAYPDAADFVLRDVSLCIRRGESMGFVGASGAGKSTLVDILLGLLRPDSGHVLVDDADIQENLRNWQRQIGYVPQSIFLTDDTLRRNVAFGLADEQIDEGAVWRALRSAQLEEFVKALPQGLEATVGERGVRLSGGQCQRIGIARALYHDPAVLVLDEATSALDNATERSVMQAVSALHGTKTVIVVAHRLSTVEHCERVYRVHAGKLLEERGHTSNKARPDGSSVQAGVSGKSL